MDLHLPNMQTLGALYKTTPLLDLLPGYGHKALAGCCQLSVTQKKIVTSEAVTYS